MINRKAFLLQLAGGGMTLLLGGCGGGGGDDAATPVSAAAGGCGAFNFSANHGHTLTIPVADLDSATAMVYNIQGSAPHNHTVTLSPVQLAALKAGQPVVVTTSNNATHSHDMTGACR